MTSRQRIGGRFRGGRFSETLGFGRGIVRVVRFRFEYPTAHVLLRATLAAARQKINGNEARKQRAKPGLGRFLKPVVVAPESK